MTNKVNGHLDVEVLNINLAEVNNVIAFFKKYGTDLRREIANLDVARENMLAIQGRGKYRARHGG